MATPTTTAPSTPAGLLRAELTGLSADANLELIQDANFNGVVDAGDVLAGSNLSGTQTEAVQRSLSAGRSFIRVSRAAGGTSSQLRLLFDAVGNSPGTLASSWRRRAR